MDDTSKEGNSVGVRLRVLLLVLLLLAVAVLVQESYAPQSGTTAVASEVATTTAPQLVTYGSQAPNIRLQDAAGVRRSLSALRGKKVVLLSFASVVCPVCNESAPAHARIYDQFKDNKEFAFWGVYINAKDAEALKAYGAEHGLKYPLLRDTDKKAKTAYGVTQTPTLVLVGKDGKVLAVFDGWNASAEDGVVTAVKSALSGETVPPPAADMPMGHG